MSSKSSIFDFDCSSSKSTPAIGPKMSRNNNNVSQSSITSTDIVINNQNDNLSKYDQEEDIDIIEKEQSISFKINRKKSHTNNNNSNEEIRIFVDEEEEEDVHQTSSSPEVVKDQNEGPPDQRAPPPQRPWFRFFFTPEPNPRQCYPWTFGRIFYVMDPRFIEPKYRCSFLSKLLLVKFFQWISVTLSSLVTAFILPREVGDWILDNFWTNYFALIIYILLFVIIRSTPIIWFQTGRILSLLIYISTLSYMCTCFYISEKTAIVPIFSSTIGLSFLILAIVIIAFKPFINGWTPTGNSSFTLWTALLVFLISILVSIVYLFSVPTNNWRFGSIYSGFNNNDKGYENYDISISRFFGFWIPSLLLALCISLIEILEMQKVICGERLALNGFLDHNLWLIASIFII